MSVQLSSEGSVVRCYREAEAWALVTMRLSATVSRPGVSTAPPVIQSRQTRDDSRAPAVFATQYIAKRTMEGMVLDSASYIVVLSDHDLYCRIHYCLRSTSAAHRPSA